MVKSLQLLAGIPPRRKQVIFELRYNFGWTYLDYAGRIINKFVKDHPEWMTTDPGSHGATLINIENGSRFTFSAGKLDLNLDKSSWEEEIEDDELGTFNDHANTLSEVVIRELSLAKFSRIGRREQYHFGCASKEETEDWLLGLGRFSIPAEQIQQVYRGKQRIAASAVILVEADEVRYRIALNGLERSPQFRFGQENLTVNHSTLTRAQRTAVERAQKAQKADLTTRFAAVVDIDAFQENPISVDVPDFLARQTSASFGTFRKLIDVLKQKRESANG